MVNREVTAKPALLGLEPSLPAIVVLLPLPFNGIDLSFLCLFIEQTFIEHLLCTRHKSKWELQTIQDSATSSLMWEAVGPEGTWKRGPCLNLGRSGGASWRR